MRVTKNPRLKLRGEAYVYDKLMQINARHLCRLIYLLMRDNRVGFYKARAKEFLEHYIAYVKYVQADGDKEVRRYRFNELLKDCPYITYARADNILTCQEGFALDDEKPLYTVKECRSDLIDNIVLAMIVLHYEYNFAEKRVARYCTLWGQCGYAPAVEWVEKRLGVTIQDNTKQDVYDFIEATTPKKQRTTLQEQKQAKAGLEAFRRWTADNTKGVV